MQGKKFVFRKAALFTLALSGCSYSTSPPPPPPSPTEGFQCLPVPTEWNEPGSLFYVDRNGDAFRVGKVTGIDGKVGTAVTPVQHSTQTFDVGVLIKTLEDLSESTGWSAQLGVTAGSSLTVRSEYQDVLHIVTDEPTKNLVSDWFTKSYTVVDGNTYYLVRESLAAKSIDYEIKAGDLVKLGGEAQFKKVAEGKLNVLERKGNNSWAIKKTLDKHVNVCVKAQRQVPVSSASGVQILQAGGFAEEIKIRTARIR